MSLLIKGMEMPVSCTECPCYDDMETCFCNVIDSYCEQYKTERHPDCPLAEIPTPHGNLIDRDDLLAYFDRKSKGKTAEEALRLLYAALKAYPTVMGKENAQRPLPSRHFGVAYYQQS